MTDMRPLAIDGRTELLKENTPHEGIMEKVIAMIGCHVITTNTTDGEIDIPLNEGIHSMADNGIRMVAKPRGSHQSRKCYSGFQRTRPRLNLWKWSRKRSTNRMDKCLSQKMARTFSLAPCQYRLLST